MWNVSAHYTELESELTCRWRLLTCKLCLSRDWGEHVDAGPTVWSWGGKKLACVAWRLWLVCLDENTISLFVLCHCLKPNLGCGICWRFLDSCRVPFVREKRGGEKGKKKEGGDTHHEPSARARMEACGVCWKYSSANCAVTVQGCLVTLRFSHTRRRKRFLQH